jgi:hypothetical protein
MRRNYLVLQRVEDMKKSTGSYAVVSVVELDERIVRGCDSIPISKHLAETFRELLAKFTKPER